MKATGESIQPGHVKSTGAVTVWHRKTPTWGRKKKSLNNNYISRDSKTRTKSAT